MSITASAMDTSRDYLISMTIDEALGLGYTIPKINQNISQNEINSTEISPFAHTVCGNSTYHDMKVHGFAYVYENGKFSFDGAAWQCTRAKCNLVIATQGGSPMFGQTIGKYATYNPGEKANMFLVMYVSKVYYTSSSTLAGYKFRPA